MLVFFRFISYWIINDLKGETKLRTEDIIEIIKKEGSNLAVVLLSGVQYFTGQFFEIEKITNAAHSQVNIVLFQIISK